MISKLIYTQQNSLSVESRGRFYASRAGVAPGENRLMVGNGGLLQPLHPVVRGTMILLLFVWSLSLVSASDESLPYPGSRLVMVDSVQIHYREFGEFGDDTRGSVLLVHGFAGSTFSWRYVADTLVAHGFHVVAVDVPPFGYSDKDPLLNQSFTYRARLLQRLLVQQWPERKWHLVGHSMGGGMVQSMGIMYLEQLLSLTIVNGAIFSSITPGEYKAPWAVRGAVRRELALWFARPALLNRWMVRRFLASAYGRKPSPAEVTGYLTPLKLRGTSRAIINSPSVSKENASLSVGDLTLPTLVIWGENDTWLRFEAFKETAEKIPDGQIVVIPQAAHCPMETHPYYFNRLLLAFLSQQVAGLGKQ